MNDIFAPGTRVTLLSNGSRMKAEVISFNQNTNEYTVKLKSGQLWTAHAMWIKKIGR